MGDIVERLAAYATDHVARDTSPALVYKARAEITRLREALSSETAAREKAERELACRDALIKDHLSTIMHLRNRVDDEAFRAETAEATIADLTRKLEATARDVALLPMVSALLRIVCQSFDSGGESARSLRALAVETVWQIISDHDNPRFEQERRDCDTDQWAYVRKARGKG